MWHTRVGVRTPTNDGSNRSTRQQLHDERANQRKKNYIQKNVNHGASSPQENCRIRGHDSRFVDQSIGVIELGGTHAAGQVQHHVVEQNYQRLLVLVGHDATSFPSLGPFLQPRFRLADEMIGALLTRVNAKSVIRELDLSGCQKITNGACLEPLRHSRVLERVNIMNLDDAGQEGALEILRTCFPYKLFQVDMHGLSSARRWFLCDWQEAQHTRERYLRNQEEAIKCSSCSLSVADQARQIMPNSWCASACHQHFCRTGSCPTAVYDYRKCGKMYCSGCKGAVQCKTCRASFCNSCMIINPCGICNERLCHRCTDFSVCSDCHRWICAHCSLQQELAVEECFGCRESYCSDCRPLEDRCHGCDEEFCEGCESNFFTRCTGCSEDFCYSCIQTRPCRDECFCSDSMRQQYRECQRCYEHVCNDCLLKTCSICGTKACGSCAAQSETAVMDCIDCGESVCLECCDMKDGVCNNCVNRRPNKRRKLRQTELADHWC